jgi:hypothetical protein
MRADEWIDRWAMTSVGAAVAEGKLIRFPEQMLETVELRGRDRSLLTQAGLPDRAAPWLSFGPQPGLLGALRDSGEAPPGTDAYVEIGFNGSGDPICLEASTGAVWYLNHDDGFRAVFVNSSVGQLTEFLLLFRVLVETATSERGQDAYLDGDIPAVALDQAATMMRAADPTALQPDTMWSDELGPID